MPFSLKTALSVSVPMFLGSSLTAFSAPAAPPAPSAFKLVQDLKFQAVSNLVASPDGTVLYTSFTSGRPGNATIGSYRVLGSGDSLSPLPALVEPNLPAPHGLLAVTPSHKFLYVADDISRGPKRLYRFGIEANGALTSNPGDILSLPYAPAALAVDSTGAFLYVLLSQNLAMGIPGGEGVLKVYAIHAGTGVLSEIAGSPFAVGSGAMALAFGGRGDIAIVSRWVSANEGLLTTYPVNKSTGVVGAALDSFPTPLKHPGKLAKGHGDLLYVGQNPASLSAKPGPPDLISAYTVAANGSLTLLPAVAVKAGRLNCLVPSAGGSLLYACIDNTLRAYTMDPATGALSQFSSVTSGAPGTRVWNAATDTSSRFVYMSNTAGSLSTYRVTTPQLSIGEVTVADTIRFNAAVSNIAASNVRSVGFFFGQANPPSPSDSSASGTLTGTSILARADRSRFVSGATYHVRPYLITNAGALFLGAPRAFLNTPQVETFDVDTAYANGALFRGASRLVQNLLPGKNNVREMNFEVCAGLPCDWPLIEVRGSKSGGKNHGQGWPANGTSTGRDSVLVFLGDLLKTQGTYYVRASQTDSAFNVVYGDWRAFTYIPKLRTATPGLSLDSFTVSARLAPVIRPAAAGVLMYKAIYFPAITQTSYDTGFSQAPFTGPATLFRLNAPPQDAFSIQGALPGNPVNGIAGEPTFYGTYHVRAWMYAGDPARLVFGNLDSLNFQPSIKIVQATRSADTVIVKVRIDPRVSLYNNDSAYVTCGFMDYPAGAERWNVLGYGPAARDLSAGAGFWVKKFTIPAARSANCNASMDIDKNNRPVKVNTPGFAVP